MERLGEVEVSLERAGGCDGSSGETSAPLIILQI